MIIRLMKEIRGEYFAILDGDDYYCDADGFSRKVNILDKPENQDYIICVSNMRRTFGDEKYTRDFADQGIYFWSVNYGKRYYDDHVTFTYRIHEGSIWLSGSQMLQIGSIK